MYLINKKDIYFYAILKYELYDCQSCYLLADYCFLIYIQNQCIQLSNIAR